MWNIVLALLFPFFMVLYTPCGLLLWADRVQSHRRIQRSRHYPGSTPWHHPASGSLCTAPESQAHTYIYVNKVDVTVCVCVCGTNLKFRSYRQYKYLFSSLFISLSVLRENSGLCHRVSLRLPMCFCFFYLITTLGIVILHGEYPITTRRHHYI